MYEQVKTFVNISENWEPKTSKHKKLGFLAKIEKVGAKYYDFAC